MIQADDFLFVCRIEKLNNTLSLFQKYLSDLAGATDPRDITQILAQKGSYLLSCQDCTLFLTDMASHQVVKYVKRVSSDVKANVAIFEEIRIPISSDTVVGHVVMSGEALCLSVIFV